MYSLKIYYSHKTTFRTFPELTRVNASLLNYFNHAETFGMVIKGFSYEKLTCKEYVNKTPFDVQIKLASGKMHTVKRLETFQSSEEILKVKYPHTGWKRL